MSAGGSWTPRRVEREALLAEMRESVDRMRAEDGLPPEVIIFGPERLTAARLAEVVPNPFDVNVCPRRQCRNRTQHSRLVHWLGWVLR